MCGSRCRIKNRTKTCVVVSPLNVLRKSTKRRVARFENDSNMSFLQKPKNVKKSVTFVENREKGFPIETFGAREEATESFCMPARVGDIWANRCRFDTFQFKNNKNRLILWIFIKIGVLFLN